MAVIGKAAQIFIGHAVEEVVESVAFDHFVLKRTQQVRVHLRLRQSCLVVSFRSDRPSCGQDVDAKPLQLLTRSCFLNVCADAPEGLGQFVDLRLVLVQHVQAALGFQRFFFGLLLRCFLFFGQFDLALLFHGLYVGHLRFGRIDVLRIIRRDSVDIKTCGYIFHQVVQLLALFLILDLIDAVFLHVERGQRSMETHSNGVIGFFLGYLSFKTVQDGTETLPQITRCKIVIILFQGVIQLFDVAQDGIPRGIVVYVLQTGFRGYFSKVVQFTWHGVLLSDKNVF